MSYENLQAGLREVLRRRAAREIPGEGVERWLFSPGLEALDCGWHTGWGARLPWVASLLGR